MEDLKLEFKEEFDRTVNLVEKNYGKSTNQSKLIVGTIICNILKQIQIDADNLLFIDFYRKHIHNAPVFEYSDFTTSQIKQIIDETPLTKENRDIAYKLYIEKKTLDQVACECGISETKTIASRKEKISSLLKSTASKLYRN